VVGNVTFRRNKLGCQSPSGSACHVTLAKPLRILLPSPMKLHQTHMVYAFHFRWASLLALDFGDVTHFLHSPEVCCTTTITQSIDSGPQNHVMPLTRTVIPANHAVRPRVSPLSSENLRLQTTSSPQHRLSALGGWNSCKVLPLSRKWSGAAVGDTIVRVSQTGQFRI
jgi:hypothetical protein